jgi:hypothetical protein
MTPYRSIIFQVALRSGQLEGADNATLEAAYTGAIASVLDGGEVPQSAFKDIVLMIEAEIAHIVASDKQNPYRNELYGRSGNLATNALIPTVSNASKEFIGMFDSINDTTDHTPLTEKPIQVVRDAAESFFNIELYHYHLSGQRIQHTRTNVYFEGCMWDRDTQETEYDALGDSPLPIVIAPTWIAGICANLTQYSGWFLTEAGYYQGIYQNGIAMLKNRELGAPVLPSQTANAEAVTN